jgi:uncharacterized protein YcbK (DUF882 family)
MSLESPFFERDEFACECGCGFDVADSELLDVLEGLRHEFGKPVIITGGNRCISHNEKVQKEANENYKPFSSKSQHIFGKAVDFKIEDVHEDKVARYLENEYPNTYGIGRYNGRTHIDVRKNKARWDKR